jgi:hypothetical protein
VPVHVDESEDSFGVVQEQLAYGVGRRRVRDTWGNIDAVKVNPELVRSEIPSVYAVGVYYGYDLEHKLIAEGDCTDILANKELDETIHNKTGRRLAWMYTSGQKNHFLLLLKLVRSHFFPVWVKKVEVRFLSVFYALK